MPGSIFDNDYRALITFNEDKGFSNVVLAAIVAEDKGGDWLQIELIDFILPRQRLVIGG